MKKQVGRSVNGYEHKCKTYLYNLDDTLVFEKYTIMQKPLSEDLNLIVGGEVPIRETENYILTYHWFSIKKDTFKQFDFE